MLSGRVFIITGVTSGFGLSTTKLLLGQGAYVAGVARRKDRLEQLAAESGDHFLPIEADILSADAPGQIVRSTIERFGQIDGLVNNAGVTLHEYVLESSLDNLHYSIDLNLKAYISLIHEALPHLLKTAAAKGYADIVNLSSCAARWPAASGSAYAAAKAGINAFSEALRKEVSPSFVRVIVIEPGLANTELAYHVPNEGLRQAGLNSRAKIQSLEAIDVAECICFCLDRPKHVNICELMIKPTEMV